MGVFSAMKQLSDAVAAVVPLQQKNATFTPIDARGAHTPLEQVASTKDRCFDIGTYLLPMDDGEAGCPQDGTGRARVGLVIRIGYTSPANGDIRLFDAKIAEDVRRVELALMNPTSWDQPTTGIISVFAANNPVANNTELGALIVELPYTMLYREEVV